MDHVDGAAAPARAADPPSAFARRAAQALADAHETWRLRRLWLTLGLLDIRLRYRGSLLGPFWLTLSTAVMVGGLGLVYSALLKVEISSYLPFLALSLVLWGFISSVVGEACTTFTQAEGVIRSLRLPYVLHACRTVWRNWLMFLHNVVVIVAVFAIFGVWPGAGALLAIPGLVLWTVVGIAACLLLGPICARFRDIPPIIGSIMQIAFFMTPVMWKPELLHPGGWWLILNPFYPLMEVVRGPLLGQLPSLGVTLAAIGYAVALVLVALALFVRARGRIAFWI